ncbi:MAG: 4Fe-4S binding protein [Desulfovibrionaceae bacterium]
MALTFTTQWCKKCGICVAFCPKKALSLTGLEGKIVHDAALCIACGMCARYCPDLVITVHKEDTNTTNTGTPEVAA